MLCLAGFDQSNVCRKYTVTNADGQDGLSAVPKRAGWSVSWQHIAAENGITGPDYVIHPGEVLHDGDCPDATVTAAANSGGDSGALLLDLLLARAVGTGAWFLGKKLNAIGEGK